LENAHWQAAGPLSGNLKPPRGQSCAVAAQAAPPSCIMMLTLHMASLGRMETGGRRALEREPGHGATAVAVTRMLAQAAVTGILLPRHRSAAVMTRPPRVARHLDLASFFEFSIRATPGNPGEETTRIRFPFEGLPVTAPGRV
jgi:hypothetical protein